jgi:hypothetical protein
LHDIFDDNFIIESMDVHDTSVTFGDDGFIVKEIKNLHFCFKNISYWHLLLSVA